MQTFDLFDFGDHLGVAQGRRVESWDPVFLPPCQTLGEEIEFRLAEYVGSFGERNLLLPFLSPRMDPDP
jgi:hypothetical protein